METYKEHIFVYGVFRDSSKKMLGECCFCGKANINGKLFRVDSFYPGFISTNDGSKVWGDVYLFDPLLLTEMDTYEGDEYRRIKVVTSSDVECWVYEYKYDVSNFTEIKSGDWHLR